MLIEMAQKAELPVLAVDLGGTKIATAIVSKGKIITGAHQFTKAHEGPESVINRILSMIGSLLELKELDLSKVGGISIAAAGAIDSNKGVVTFSPNLPGWRNVPLKDIVEEKYGINTYVLNDASAAALGEHQFGAGRRVDNLILLTLGTGIGGGIIINGELYLGPSGAAGEIGHMSIDVNGQEDKCGNIGCLELIASGTAVAKEAIRRVKQGEKSSLADIVSGNIENITTEMVATAAKNGDSLAIEVISRMANYLGIGLVNLVNIFNPEMIVIGGGMANMGDILFEPVRRIVKERAFQLAVGLVQIVQAELGNNAGMIGAAEYASTKGIGRRDA